jgi:hypothetical protein
MKVGSDVTRIMNGNDGHGTEQPTLDGCSVPCPSFPFMILVASIQDDFKNYCYDKSLLKILTPRVNDK